MEIKISKSTSNINNKRSQKKYDNIKISYSITESTIRNKPIKKNNSQKTFNNRRNLKLNSYNNISKAHSERPVLTTLSENEIDKIKNTILQKLKENKNKIVDLKNNNYSNISNNSSRINKTKITKKNKVDIIMNKIEKKFEKYNKGKMAYDVYHDYQKLNFDDNNNFLERMELYSLKKEYKEKTINDYIRKNSPKISNTKKNRVFDILINDVKIRKQKKERQEKEELNFFKFNNSKNNLKTKKVNEKEINEIVKRLSKPRRNLMHYNNINKFNNKDNKDKNDININNGGKIKENKIVKSFSMKSIKKAKKIEEINNRLYKKEMDKKDIAYKLVMKNVYELLKNNNKIKPYIRNNNNDCISYDQLKQLRNKNKTINTESIVNNKEYKFRENEEDLDNEKDNNNNNKNNENNYKGIKTHNNFNHKNYNELFSFSGPQTNNSIHNLKISIMIDNFFSNK